MPTFDRDGTVLHYEEAGAGSPPILLVHCWAGDHTLMAPQLDCFRCRHRVIAPDLRGFGQSDKPAQRYTVPGFSDDLVALARHLDLGRFIVVGHSLGGSVALDLAARYPESVAACVILEALAVAPPVLVDNFRPVLDGVRGPASAQVVRGFLDQLFGPTFDPAEKARLIDRMAASEHHVLVSALECLLEFDSAAAAAAVRAPTLYLSSGPWYTDVERFRSLCPQLVTGQAVGCGHYFELEVPAQVNAMVERFIELQVLRAAR